jgi:hypothetical protein
MMLVWMGVVGDVGRKKSNSPSMGEVREYIRKREKKKGGACGGCSSRKRE